MQIVTLEFIAEQFQEFADTDPVHWCSDEGAIWFDDVPVLYQRFEDHFRLDVEGIVVEVPRI